MKYLISLFILVSFISCTKTESELPFQLSSPQGIEAHIFDLAIAGPASIDVVVLNAELDTVLYQITNSSFIDYRLYLDELATARHIRVTSPVYLEYRFMNIDSEILEQGVQDTQVVQYEIP